MVPVAGEQTRQFVRAGVQGAIAVAIMGLIGCKKSRAHRGDCARALAAHGRITGLRPSVEGWQSEATIEEAAMLQKNSENEPDSNPLRILVVDDEALLLYHLADMIEDLGHVPVCASSGPDALTFLADDSHFDLVITDQSMPDMKGTELAAAVRQRSPQLPIVLASGYGEYASDGDLDLHCLAKPFTFADLERVIAEIALSPNS
ncbi:response regulator [Sphingomonas sp. TX0543]|uniref:response regulator n=1 Tax=Sphingomonas sp. TX0543 TaxID=3399682 RepID=UPI003AFA4AFB